MTPVSTIVAAYARCLEDETLNGEAIEGSVDKLLIQPRPKMENGPATKRAVTVWDPLFKHYHGELSGLPDAIK